MGRQKGIDGVLFDFDGVICDTEPLAMDHLTETLALHGIELTPEQHLSLVGTDGSAVMDRLLEGSDLTSDELFAEDDARGNIHVICDMVPMPGVLEFIRGVRAAGLPTALVSTTLSRYILAALDQMGIVGLFDSIVCGDMVERRKPDPLCYATSLANLGLDASRCVAFEDSPTGIHAAKAAGLYVCGYEGSVIDQDTSEADEAISTFVGLTL
jgi:beta-phosphoglucomutase-like phosphatase (HAD superfamily)